MYMYICVYIYTLHVVSRILMSIWPFGPLRIGRVLLRLSSGCQGHLTEKSDLWVRNPRFLSAYCDCSELGIWGMLLATVGASFMPPFAW